MMNTAENTSAVAVSTQPLVYGVAGATLFGVAVNDWVIIGTGVLLVLNIGLAIYKWINIWRDKDGRK